LTQSALPSTHPVPAVFVMNLHYTGIGIGRNLRSFGVEVHGLTSDPNAAGVRSRVFRRIHLVPHVRDEPEALCDRLLELRHEYSDPPVIFPTSDADVLFLARFAERLAPHYRLPPGRDALPQLMDKLNLASLAAKQSVSAPKTVLCASERDIGHAGLVLAFPVVIKPRSAHEWRKKGVWEQVGARKAIMVDTPDDLMTEYRSLASVSAEVLLQEYIPGGDSDIVVCCCYIDESGELLGHFTGRKLRQSPPLFGTGCLVEASPVPEIIPLSQLLLQGCGYAGIAEVEFKRDPASGHHVLIEVNPRHWDQHQLGTMVGVNLTWIAYQKAIGLNPEPCVPVYDAEQAPRWIAEREALFLIARSAMAEIREDPKKARVRFPLLRVAKRTFTELLRLVRGPALFSVFSRSDPVPGILFSYRLTCELFVLARHARTQKA
jgi:D-aspartate ligase